MKKINTAILIALGVFQLARAQGTWTQKNNFAGSARYRAISFTIENFGYYGTGNYVPGASETDDMWKYDPTTDAWSQIASIPSGMQAGEAFTIGNYGYAGIGWQGGNSFADFYQYDPVANSWLAKASFPNNQTHDAGSFVLNNKGYIVGGAVPYSDAQHNEVYEYDISSDTWTQMTSFPTNRRIPACFAYNGVGYAGLGQNPNPPGGNATDLLSFNATLNSWNAVSSFPGSSTLTALTRYSQFVIGDNAYFCLEYQGFWRYNITTDQWLQLPNLPFPNAVDGTFVINGKGYVISASDGQVWEFDPQGSGNCLVAYYPFTGNAADSSGNGNDGIVNGATLTTDRFGNVNSAYAFDGSNDNITVLNNSLLNIQNNQSFSVSLWIKHNGTNSAKYFLSKYNGIGGANPSYAFGTQDVNNPGGPYSWFEAAGFGQENRDNITLLTDNNWHHYVCVYSSGNSIKLYIDNQLKVTNPITYTGSIINALDLVIGAGANLQQNYSGSIDDVGIYSCALSDSEIAVLYNGNTNCLVAYYPFTGNAADSSGNGNDGTVNGATLTTDRFGIQNSAYSFDGNDDYIECPNNAIEIFGSNQPSTFAFWFTLNEKSKIMSFFSKGLHSAGFGGNRYVAIEYQGTLSRFAVSLYNGSVLHDALATIDTNQIVVGHWYHLAVVRNDSISIYLDGQKLNSINTNNGWSTDYNAIVQNLPCRWGVRNYTNPDTVGDVLNGKIDDILIYNCALSSAEISTLYDIPVSCVKPYDLNTISTTNTSAIISWSNAVSADTFRVRYSVNGTTAFAWKDINGSVGSGTILNGLHPNTTYQFQVASRCAGISTPYSASFVFTTQNSQVACVTPFDLSASAITNNSANISWTNSVTADTFRVRYSISGTTAFAWKDINGSAGSSTSLASLLPNTTYQFQVASRCAGVSSAYSSSCIFTTANSTQSCITPFGTTTTDITGTSAIVNWSGLVTADTFRVRYSINGTNNFFWKDVNGSGGITSTQIIGLALNTTYQWQVRTICSGVSPTPYSTSVVFTTLTARLSEMSPDMALKDLQTFPNPVQTILTVSFVSRIEVQGKMMIFDISGRLVANEELLIKAGENISEINLSHFESGMYFLVIENAGEVRRTKFFVE